MNKQKAEKATRSLGLLLDVVSVFYTIQGEGPFSGQTAIFIRLAGCNLECPFCDTDYTNGRSSFTVDELYNKTTCITEREEVDPCLIVITGGEPFRQNITSLCQKFLNHGFTVQVETNGTLPPSRDLSPEVNIVCSPKTPGINTEMSKRADFFKYVIDYKSLIHTDGLPAQALGLKNKSLVYRQPNGNKEHKIIYVQPMDTDNNEDNALNLKAVTASTLRFNYIAQIQLHKYLGVD